MIRTFFLVSWMLLLATCSPKPQTQTAAARPNFVFILVDDLGWADLGCYGSQFYETPNLDRLASQGTRFTQAYAACPVCSPTRASILTGKFPVRTGITDYIDHNGGNQPQNWKRDTKMLPAPYQDHLALSEVTMAEALKQQGYATFFAGKWHLGGEGFYPENQGFDINIGGYHSGGPYTGKKYFSPYENPKMTNGPEGELLPLRLGQETAQFIQQHADKPFLAYLSFYSVHTPLMTTAELEAKYQAKRAQMGLADDFGQEGANQVRLTQSHAVYAGMVESMDRAVGTVMEAIEQAGIADRTVIVFTSDNGGLSTAEGSPTSNLPIRAGKGWLYEGGIREPLIIRWPGVVKAGKVEDTYVVSTDFYPTFLEMAQLPVPQGQDMDGKSFLPLLKGQDWQRGEVFWHYPHYSNQGGKPGSVMREGDWKLIEWLEDRSLELYNLADDPEEKYNLAGQNPTVAARMKTRLEAWRQQTGALYPKARN